MWEMCAFSVPFVAAENWAATHEKKHIRDLNTAIDLVVNRRLRPPRLECATAPPQLAQRLNELLALCWRHEGDERPDFTTICSTLEDLKDMISSKQFPLPIF
jgi:hypothetical protein